MTFTPLRCVASILLLFCFLLLGSGTLEYIHDLQHDAEDAREDAIATAAGLPVHEHHHDENNCPTHAALHMTFTLTAWVPILILLGLFVAFLTLLDAPPLTRTIPMRIDCRGPPVSFLFPSISL